VEKLLEPVGEVPVGNVTDGKRLQVLREAAQTRGWDEGRMKPITVTLRRFNGNAQYRPPGVNG
jgi:hypothetical protein